MSYKKSYTLKELNVIAKAITILLLSSDHTYGVTMNSFHIGRFYSKTHYIDFNEKARKCKVYKKYKGWEAGEEKLSNQIIYTPNLND